mmetsp:Transcript_15555/g.44060  ORF Transcript_15555/g.44060 Transcript_15555/m.44060 type:complete len:173 (-) Transcript_15555:30-548(-)
MSGSRAAARWRRAGLLLAATAVLWALIVALQAEPERDVLDVGGRQASIASTVNTPAGSHWADNPVAAEAFYRCSRLCHRAKARMSPAEWTAGPCLSGKLVLHAANLGERWGCDIAHCPREPIDNDRANQCGLPRWVELDGSCTFLRFRDSETAPRQGVGCSADGVERISAKP